MRALILWPASVVPEAVETPRTECPVQAHLAEGKAIAQLDKFIQSMFARNASSLSVGAGKPPTLLLDGRPSPMMDQRPTAAQVRRLVAEITPATMQADLRGPGHATFTYAAPPSGRVVSVAVSDWAGETVAIITPAPSGPGSPSLTLDLDPDDLPPPSRAARARWPP